MIPAAAWAICAWGWWLLCQAAALLKGVAGCVWLVRVVAVAVAAAVRPREV